MPLAWATCPVCRFREELLLPKEDGKTCSICLVSRSVEVRLEVNFDPANLMVARTAAKWGDNSVNGVYDRGLGARYRNSQEREAIMKAKGLIHESDLGNKHWADDDAQKKQNYVDKWNGIAQRFEDNKAKYKGDPHAGQRAMCDTMPASEILAGKHNYTEED